MWPQVSGTESISAKTIYRSHPRDACSTAFNAWGYRHHSLEQAQSAEEAAGADYIGCGPTFHRYTKNFDLLQGVSFLTEVAEHIRIPSFAIGGITLERLDEVLATGFCGLRSVMLFGTLPIHPEPPKLLLNACKIRVPDRRAMRFVD